MAQNKNQNILHTKTQIIYMVVQYLTSSYKDIQMDRSFI